MVKHYGCPCGHSAQVLEGQLAPACCRCGGPMTFLRMSGAPKAKSPMVQLDAALKAQQQADVNGCLPGHPFYGINEPMPPVEEYSFKVTHAGFVVGGAGPLPPCNHEAELSALRAKAGLAEGEAKQLREELQRCREAAILTRDSYGNRDHRIKELEAEVGRQALELRRAGRK